MRIAAVIPAYRVANQILDVLVQIGPECTAIYVVDDACPQNSGDLVERNCRDSRVRVLRHATNRGVGAAVVTGYRAALSDGAQILVKIDGDGQMCPSLLMVFVSPIASGEADYTKGNRFFDIEHLRGMPPARLLGNAVLTFMSKLSTGYWDIFDPTNGYTAIDADVLRQIPLDKISDRYFFESDLLFRLNVLRAVVVDVPMRACYGDETSSMNLLAVSGEFFLKHCRNFVKRIFYNYYLRGMSLASIELPLGIALTSFGLGFGVSHWYQTATTATLSSAGTVMLAALPILMGLQLILAFLGYDIVSVPRRPIRRLLSSIEPPGRSSSRSGA